jgi:hypothetical protein
VNCCVENAFYNKKKLLLLLRGYSAPLYITTLKLTANWLNCQFMKNLNTTPLNKITRLRNFQLLIKIYFILSCVLNFHKRHILWEWGTRNPKENRRTLQTTWVSSFASQSHDLAIFLRPDYSSRIASHCRRRSREKSRESVSPLKYEIFKKCLWSKDSLLQCVWGLKGKACVNGSSSCFVLEN